MSGGQPQRTPGSWRRLLRTSFGVCLAIVLVTLPLVLAVPARRAWLVAFFALCAYPVLDLPRNVARPSWWLGTVVSTLVFLGLTPVLVSAVNFRQPLRESAMIFGVPYLMFLVVLLLSGVVRLVRRRRGQPLEPGVRIAAAWGGAFCLLLIGIPLAVHSIEATLDDPTGDTPPNTVFAGPEGEVRSADAQRLSLVNGGLHPSSYRLTPETRYGFWGRGRHPDDSQAGPSWLKPGRRVSVNYVYRDHVAQAESIHIWVDP